MDPFYGQALVLHAQVLRLAGGAGVAEDVEAEVHGDDNDVLGFGEVLAVVEGCVCAAN